MEIKINSDEFKCLKLAAKIIPGKVLIPVTDKFKFDVTEDGIRVTATDMYGTFVIKNIAVTEIKGECISFLVDARLFMQAITSIPSQPIVIKTGEDTLTVEYSKGVFDVPMYTAEGYPELARGEEFTLLEVPSVSDYLKGLEQVVKFAGNDELRPVMSGVYVEMKNSVLTFVATDAQMLATKTLPVNDSTEVSTIVHTAAARMIIDILREADENESALMRIDSRNVMFETAKYEITYRQIEGRYPNFRSVIPDVSNQVIEFDIAELSSILKRAAVFATITSLIVFDIQRDNRITLTSQNIDFNRSLKETINTETGFKMRIGLSGSRLASLLDTIKSSTVKASFIDSSRAVRFTPVDDDSVTIIQMPMVI